MQGFNPIVELSPFFLSLLAYSSILFFYEPGLRLLHISSSLVPYLSPREGMFLFLSPLGVKGGFEASTALSPPFTTLNGPSLDPHLSFFFVSHPVFSLTPCLLCLPSFSLLLPMLEVLTHLELKGLRG